VESISTVLCTYNRAASLSATLESFSRLTLPTDLDWELIVVDNNSKDKTREVIQTFAESVPFCVRYIFEGQQGRSSALNAGIEAARNQIIAFTDDDVIVHTEWVTSLRQAFAECNCAAVGGRIIPVWHHPKPDWLEMEGQQAVVHFDLGNEMKEIKDPPLGANSAFRKDNFEKYGLFRLDLGVSGSDHGIVCEDTEFGWRLLRAGEKIVYAPKALIYHPVDPHRATKAYFLKWYYNAGRSVVRAGDPPEMTTYFGVPRWLVRRIAINLGKWMFTFDKKRRFRHKLQTFMDTGKIIESYQMAGRTRVF
jgi:glucosyl-dolichyl phosphate glucuronosyltransferase